MTPAIAVVPIETPGLGDRSYLVHDGEVALVVDPQRDVDRVFAAAARAGVRISHVVETHIHNDYVTGGYALARAAGAAYLVNADDPVGFDRVGVRDGDVVQVGAMTVRVLHTPGHTHTHLAYAVSHGGHPVAVFTGGSLLYGSTGRPDLLGPDHTDALVRAQWRSARRLADELPDDTAVYPTHGFGSFCSATQSDAATSTIGRERVVNPVLLRDERAFVEELLAGLDAHPAYYAHMAPANLAGPAAPDLSPPALADPAELRARIEAGEWVVDLRAGTAFAAGHLAGSLSFPLDGQFVTYLGWLIPWGTPVTLLGATVDAVAEAQRELVRIGIDRPAAAAVGGPRDWAGGAPLATYRRASFGELAEAGPVPMPPPCSMCGATRNGWKPGSPARSTSRSTSCWTGSTRSRRVRCGCTAAPATAPASSPRCSRSAATRWSRWTTSSTGPSPRVSRWSPRPEGVPREHPARTGDCRPAPSARRPGPAWIRRVP